MPFFVMRIQILPGNCGTLHSTNRLYRPIEISPDGGTDLQFIGRVVASMHEW